MALACPYSKAERETWAPPEDLTTTEWADRYRILSAEVSAIPGPYRSSRVPYVRGIGDALSDPTVREVNLMAPAQSSKSELARNWIGRCIDVDPGPIMVVFPSQDSCQENMDERIVPMFRDCPQLSRHLTGKAWDVKKGVIHLRSCSIYTGWSGSPQALASRPIRYVLMDEVDKYVRWRGVEADPISLAKARTTTYGHRSKVFVVSTPTIPEGPIALAVKNSGDVRDYCPRCVHCGQHVLPEWKNVHWEGQKGGSEAKMRATRLALETGDTTAYYRCQHCKEDMDQEQWWEGVCAGEWVSVGCEPGEHPRSESVGFRLSGLCSPWLGVQKLAARFAVAQMKGMGELQDFYNNKLGLPFWGDSDKGDPTLIVRQQRIWELASEGGARYMVPEWATAVVCGMDSGKTDHPYVVRAFGAGFRSQLLDYGVLEKPSQIFALLDRDWHGVGGRTFKIRRLLLDSGGGRGSQNASRTEEIYRIAQKDPARIWAIKGFGGRGAMPSPIMTRTVNYRQPGVLDGPTLDVRLSTLDVGYFKDVLAGYIAAGHWLPFQGVGQDYVSQVASERKKLIERRVKSDKTSVEIWRWVPRHSGIANHTWDAETYCVAAAHMVGADEIPDEPTYVDDERYLDDGGGWTPPQAFTRGGSWI